MPVIILQFLFSFFYKNCFKLVNLYNAKPYRLIGNGSQFVCKQQRDKALVYLSAIKIHREIQTIN